MTSALRAPSRLVLAVRAPLPIIMHAHWFALPSAEHTATQQPPNKWKRPGAGKTTLLKKILANTQGMRVGPRLGAQGLGVKC
jgi:hypothetical protein